MRTKIELGALLVVVISLAVMSFKVKGYQAELIAAERVRDSLLLEEAAAEAAADGWAVQFGELETDLLGRVARRDSMSQRLAASLERANARVRSLVEVVAVLKDSLVSVGAPGDTTEAGEVTFHGAINDGLLTGSWRFLQPSLFLTYGVTVPLEIITSEGGGRWLVTARSSDPRVSLSVPGFYFEPPAPVQKCGLGTRVRWLLMGGLTGAALRSIY